MFNPARGDGIILFMCDEKEKTVATENERWLDSAKVVAILSGIAKENEPQYIETTKQEKNSVWKKLKKKMTPHLIWLIVTSAFGVAAFFVVFNFYNLLYPKTEALLLIQSIFAFLLVYFSEDFVFCKYYEPLSAKGIKGMLSLLGHGVAALFLDVLFLFFIPGCVQEMVGVRSEVDRTMLIAIGNISSAEDLYRLATINFTILAADCGIPALAVSVREKLESKRAARVICFLVGSLSIASLLTAIFAKEEPTNIMLAGTFVIMYCLINVLWSAYYFLMVFPVFDRAKRKGSDNKR